MRPFRYYVLNRDPPVLSYLGVDSIKTEGGIPPLPPDIGPLTLLEHPLSWRGDRDQMQRVAAMQTRLDQVNISHHLMVNSGDENELRIECDVRGGMFSQNIFVNENIFQPETARKRYDAVHIAGMYPVKRHQLASGIEKLYVITYGGGDLHTFCPQIAHEHIA